MTAALTKLRADHEATEKAERDAFAQKLADKLGISVDKVKSVFAAGPFGGPASTARATASRPPGGRTSITYAHRAM